MGCGVHGLAGHAVAKLVEREVKPGHDHAINQLPVVEEHHVEDLEVKAKTVTLNAALLLVDGALGLHGVSVLGIMNHVKEQDEDLATTQHHDVVEDVQEALLTMTTAPPINAMPTFAE